MDNVHEILRKEGLTTLLLRYDFRTGKFQFFASKDWNPDTDWIEYNKTFTVESILVDDPMYHGTKEVEVMFAKHGGTEYLEEIKELVREGKHIGINFYFHEGFNMKYIVGVHSNVLGLNNTYQCTYAGATRRHMPDDVELDVIVDALNLGRAMSFKNVAVNIPFGGCKTTVIMEPLDVKDMKRLGFMGYITDVCRTTTGPDMFLPKDMVVPMNENFSMQWAGGAGSPLGDTAVPTAYGTYLAMKQAVKFKTGNESLDGMSFAVQGLGAIGYNIIMELAKEKTKLFVTDISQENIDRVLKDFPNQDITVVKPDEILKLEVDILVPCAMGGILDDEVISELKVKYVFGPANNQLKASSQEEEIRLAKLLAKRDILFQTEWWHNAAGVLGATEEAIHGREPDYTKADLMKKVEDILPTQTWMNLNRAKEEGVTPTESAYAHAQKLVYGEE